MYYSTIAQQERAGLSVILYSHVHVHVHTNIMYNICHKYMVNTAHATTF